MIYRYMFEDTTKRIHETETALMLHYAKVGTRDKREKLSVKFFHCCCGRYFA